MSLLFYSSSSSFSHSVMSNFLLPYKQWPTRLLCPWNSPGKNTGAGSHFLLQRIIPTQGSNSCLPHGRQILYHLSHQETPHLHYKSMQVLHSILQHSHVCSRICQNIFNKHYMQRCAIFVLQFHIIPDIRPHPPL